MALQFMFLASLTITVALGIAWGAWPERFGALCVSIASVLTFFAAPVATESWRAPEIGILAIDCLLLAALLAIALRSNRFWPLWASAFHSIAVVTHLAQMTVPRIVPIVYATVAEMWSYPVLISLAIGAVANRRRLRAPTAMVS